MRVKKKLHNNSELTHRRKELRNSATPQELKLWKELSHSKLEYKFRRQQSVGSYILDFYCSEKRLAIEIDGSQHVDNQEYDKSRTEYLESAGIMVVRFWNNEVDSSLDGVIEKIRDILQSRNVKYYEDRSDT